MQEQMLLSSTCLCTNTLPHHDACRQLRERMAADREAAVEAERTSAHKRLADAAERYEASAQQARMRLAAEHDRRLAEQEDAARAQRYEFESKNSSQKVSEPDSLRSSCTPIYSTFVHAWIKLQTVGAGES
jgi:hypothetical protein